MQKECEIMRREPTASAVCVTEHFAQQLGYISMYDMLYHSREVWVETQQTRVGFVADTAYSRIPFPESQFLFFDPTLEDGMEFFTDEAEMQEVLNERFGSCVVRTIQ
jgi:hypothetical protein